ncbi:MAG: exodeoxyribonuclease III [Chitinophagaceae bacterium]|nr:exodeoxyribonuclease III [Chitinophagaceae bacterium]
MKIATYNVNGIRSRLPVLLQWLKDEGPDVACLQELKAPQEVFPENEIREAGYQAIWKGQKSWNGVAILSKNYPITERKKELPGDNVDEQSRYIEAEVNGIIIGCIYLPNGNPVPGPKFDYKLSWMKRLQDHASSLLSSGKPVILTGDFNVIPEERDVYNPERVKDDALFQPESRQALQDLIDLGFTDTIRHLYPDEIIYTYWDYFRNAYNRNAGMRIDHFLVNKSLLPRVVKAGVDKDVRGWEKTSDHAPVWIEIK